jgi:hypothetical protein
MENIDNLDERELLILQDEVNNRIEKIQKEKQKIREEEQDSFNRQNNVKNKTKLSQLTNRDRIFGIRFAWDEKKGEYLKNLGAKWSVDFIDYCDVEGYTDKKYRKDSIYNNISISHKKEPWGISTPISDEEAEKPYFLSINTFDTGYNSFYTLSPETWKVDIQKAFDDLSKRIRKYQKIEHKKMAEKVQLVLNSETKINEFLEKNK